MRHRQAFTLVELLVVVGIIAILISLLVPTLSRARESAVTTKCLSTQRQFGMAVQMYVNEFRGWLPPYRFPMADAAPSANYASPYYFQFLPWRYFKNTAGSAYVCPSDDFLTRNASGLTGGARGAYSNMAGRATVYFSFAFNGSLPRQSTPVAPQSAFPGVSSFSYLISNPTPISKLKSPSSVAYTVETQAGAILYYSSLPFNFRFQHGPKGNTLMTIAYADGHAGTLSRAEVLARDPAVPSTWPSGFANLWFGRPELTAALTFP